MSAPNKVTFLVDVDNTLLDNDWVTADLQQHLNETIGESGQRKYFEILAQLSDELGYRDYLGALQRYRNEHERDVRLIAVSTWLVDYPFVDRLYPNAIAVLGRLQAVGPTVILSDGDVVFQPRKIDRSGIGSAVNGHVLVYIHKERMLEDIVERYPSEHYVLVDDKPRILAAFKQAWGDRVTTLWPKQGHYANDPAAVTRYPGPDVAVEHIGDLLDRDVAALAEATTRAGATADQTTRA